jgi:hypothetical protein
MSMTKALSLACLVLIACSAEAAARCVAPGVEMFDGQIVSRRIVVKAGTPCRLSFISLGPIYNVEFPKRPAHGTVQVGEILSVIYTPHRGFVGRDTFTHVHHGQTPTGRPTRFGVRVLVTVVP